MCVCVCVILMYRYRMELMLFLTALCINIFMLGTSSRPSPLILGFSIAMAFMVFRRGRLKLQ